MPPKCKQKLCYSNADRSQDGPLGFVNISEFRSDTLANFSLFDDDVRVKYSIWLCSRCDAGIPQETNLDPFFLHKKDTTFYTWWRI